MVLNKKDLDIRISVFEKRLEETIDEKLEEKLEEILEFQKVTSFWIY